MTMWDPMQSSESSHLSITEPWTLDPDAKQRIASSEYGTDEKRVGKDMGEGEGERWRRISLPAC
jgi:hypothetical protein